MWFFRRRSVHDKLNDLTWRLNLMAVDFARVIEAVRQETTMTKSVLALMAGMKVSIDDLRAQVAAGLDPAAIQAELDKIATDLEGNDAEVAAAITANTPAEPASEPVPAPEPAPDAPPAS